MSDCIFGIKTKGVSLEVSQISVEDDQSEFDYICNVSLKKSYNGNGTYDVSILNKDCIHGMPVGKWRITKAWIDYNWGNSYAQLKMEDEEGKETCDITASIDKGSSGGFYVPSLARTIFTKAQEVVRDYPNAIICTAMEKLKKSQKGLNVDYLKKCLKWNEKISSEEYIDNVEYVLSKLSNHLNVYTKTKELLKEREDQRSKLLLKSITSECKNLLDNFKE